MPSRTMAPLVSQPSPTYQADSIHDGGTAVAASCGDPPLEVVRRLCHPWEVRATGTHNAGYRLTEGPSAVGRRRKESDDESWETVVDDTLVIRNAHHY